MILSNLQYKSHHLPSPASYGVSVVKILEKSFDRVITAPHCICTVFELMC